MFPYESHCCLDEEEEDYRRHVVALPYAVGIAGFSLFVVDVDFDVHAAAQSCYGVCEAGRGSNFLEDRFKEVMFGCVVGLFDFFEEGKRLFVIASSDLEHRLEAAVAVALSFSFLAAELGIDAIPVEDDV